MSGAAQQCRPAPARFVLTPLPVLARAASLCDTRELSGTAHNVNRKDEQNSIDERHASCADAGSRGTSAAAAAGVLPAISQHSSWAMAAPFASLSASGTGILGASLLCMAHDATTMPSVLIQWQHVPATRLPASSKHGSCLCTRTPDPAGERTSRPGIFRWFSGAAARDAPADELPPGLSKQQRADVMAMAKAVTTHDTFAAGDMLAGGR